MDERNKIYKVVIQNTATDMLVDHARFLAQVCESAANRLTNEFVNMAKTLEYMPERCPWLTYDEIAERKYRKLIFEKHYMLVFQVIENTVYVDAMIDCRSDYTWLL